MRNSTPKARAFTLIELLIVVAIIAILAAIAVPNFLEAQTRSKVSRVKADMRTTGNAIEMYYVDNNSYPTGWGINVDPGNPDSHSLFLLSTPISYVTSGDMQDPFHPAKDDRAMYTTVQYDPMTPDGKMVSGWNIQSGYVAERNFPWWMLISVGPDKIDEFTYSLNDGEGIQYRVREADSDIGLFSDIYYDPTNGTVSRGNIFRVGGSQMNAAGRFIQSHN